MSEEEAGDGEAARALALRDSGLLRPEREGAGEAATAPEPALESARSEEGSVGFSVELKTKRGGRLGTRAHRRRAPVDAPPLFAALGCRPSRRCRICVLSSASRPSCSTRCARKRAPNA